MKIARVCKYLSMTWLGLLVSTLGVQAETPADVCVTNHAEHPVYSTAIRFDHELLCQKLGVPQGTPISFSQADRKAFIPTRPGSESGHALVYAYTSLGAGEQLRLQAHSATSWTDAPRVVQASYDDSSKRGFLSNGVLRVEWNPEGWSVQWASPEGSGSPWLIRNARLDCWLDQENRGRMLYTDPRDFHLLPAAAAHLEKSECQVTPEGRVAVQLVRRYEGFASDVTLREKIELLPGISLLRYSVRWDNTGDQTKWVAYTRYGGGLIGEWGPLLAGPLLRRTQPQATGELLTVSPTMMRPGWMSQICRIGLEGSATGCGVAVSTLEKVPAKLSAGSMVWLQSNQDFQFNLLDPRQGQFPLAVQKGTPVEDGFAFYFTQAGVEAFPIAEALWTHFAEGQPLPASADCSVFLNGQPLQVQEVAGVQDLLKTSCTYGGTLQAAVCMNFDRKYRLRLRATQAGPDHAVDIFAYSREAGSAPVRLLHHVQAGPAEVDINQVLGWRGLHSWILQVHGATQAGVESLSLLEAPPEAPALLSPLPESTCTDLAVMFRWKGAPGVLDYELQYSRRDDLQDAQTFPIRNSCPYPCFLPRDEDLPAAGPWYWRVRALRHGVAGVWSEIRRLTVNTDHSTRPLKHSVDARHPLFTLEASMVRDFSHFVPCMSADLQPYIGIVVEGYVDAGLPVDTFLRGVSAWPHPVLMRGHGPGAPLQAWASLADIEWAFTHVPNFVGIQGGESLSWFYHDPDAMRYTHRLLQLCAKYGMLYHEADGTYEHDKWQRLMDTQGEFIRKYGQYLVLTQKNNIIRRQFLSQSATLGLWLGGITHQHGAWEDGGFYWQNAGFGELGECFGERKGRLPAMPGIFWDLVLVMGMSHGCGMYSLDGQMLMYHANGTAGSPPPNRAVLWNDRGEMAPAFERFVGPLIRASVERALIPTRDEVLANIRLAVFNDGVSGDSRQWPYYVEYGPLFAGTYGFAKMGPYDGQLWEFFPNTGRYYFIPVLPQGNIPLTNHVRNLPLSMLQDPVRVTEVFNAAYPARHQGDALVTQAGDSLFILNTHENEDRTESYQIDLAVEGITTLAGKIGPHAYVVGKQDPSHHAVWLQANTEYPGRDTVLDMHCTSRPEVEIMPPTAARELVWNERTRTLRISLSHEQGAAELRARKRP